MTNEQINTAIARECGWTDIHDSGPWHNHTLWGYPPMKPGQGGNAYKYLPGYCTDLNAMHDAEKSLNEMNQHTYAIHLGEVTKSDYHDDMSFFCATARQRAEAFLRTVGKWEEGE